MLKNLKRKFELLWDEEIDMSELHGNGFQVFGINKISDNLCDKLYKLSDKSERIFNTRTNDNKRRQIAIPKEILRKSEIRRIKNELSELFPNHIQTDWNVLKSLPGCGVQMAHTDYVPDSDLASVSDKMIPLSVIIPLEEGTTLRVWPKSHRYCLMNPKLLPKKQIKYMDIELGLDKMLVFRGDLVHAGSAYKKKRNVRVHLFLDSPEVKRVPNQTWIIRNQYKEIKNRIIE